MKPAQYLRADRDQTNKPTLSQQAHSLVDRAYLNGYAAATDSALSRLAFIAAVDAKSVTKNQLISELRSIIAHIEADFSKRVE